LHLSTRKRLACVTEIVRPAMAGSRKIVLVHEYDEEVALCSREGMEDADSGVSTLSDDGLSGSGNASVPELKSVKSNYNLPASRQRQSLVIWLGTLGILLGALSLLAVCTSRRGGSEGILLSPSSLSSQPLEDGRAAMVHPDSLQNYASVDMQVEPWPIPVRQASQSVPWPTSCVYGETPECPAKALFRNPAVLAVAAENLMRVGQGGVLTAGDKDLVSNMTSDSFANIIGKFDKLGPEVAKDLEDTPVFETQKDMVLHAMRLLSNPQVQFLGGDVVQMVRLCRSSERKAVLRHVVASLSSRLEELQGLVHELVPEAPAKLWTGKLEWTSMLDEQNIQAIQSSRTAYLAHPTYLLTAGSLPRLRLSKDQKSFIVLQGIAEEGRALVEILQLYIEGFGTDNQLVVNAASSASSYHFGRCLASARLHNQTDSLLGALTCPLRLGALGLVALHVVAGMQLSTVV